jgi:DNA-binding NarL/FixJ family response regulator
MIEGYKSILSQSEFENNISVACTCEEGYRMLFERSNKYDIVFIDIELPPYADKNIRDGSDLAKIIRKQNPPTKVVIFTSHVEGFILYNLVQQIHPEGFIVKSDITPEDFLKAYSIICSNGVFYSNTVKQALKDITSRAFYLDNLNRQIVYLLAKGIKTKNLPEHLPLSISAIDKRKVQIKDYFNLEKGNDEDIIREARKAGFI